MGDATMRRNTDTQPVSLPVNSAARECRAGSETCCNLAHHWSPLGLGTDGSNNLMTLLGETQVGQAKDATDDRSMTKVMLVYQGALLATALVLFVLALPYGLGDPLAVLGLALVAAIAERGRVRLTGNIEVSISVLPTVFAAAMFGPLAAMIVAAFSIIGDFPVGVLLATPRTPRSRSASQVGRLHRAFVRSTERPPGLPQQPR